MARHNDLGKEGEKLALEMLVEKGWQILDTNWRHKKEEVDIIALDGKMLVIVEVKTRSTDYFGNPEEAVGAIKANNLMRAADAYLEIKDINSEVRFDVVAIVLNNRKAQIRHIRNAFYPGDF